MHLGLTPWDFSGNTAASLQQQAAWAESVGYRSFWLPESHFNDNALPDPLMLLAAVAGATRRIQLATTSFLLTVRNPLQAAEQVAVLDNLSDGRVVLGVGRGFASDMLKAFNVVPRDKRKVFEETLETMRLAWRGEPVPIGDDRCITLNPLPVQKPHPPIWVAAFGPKALAQAGRLGMPYIASPMESMSTLEANYAAHAHAAREAGGSPVQSVPIMRTIYVSSDAQEVARLKAALADTPSRRDEPVAVDDWAIVGDAAAVADRLAEYEERLGMTHLIATRLRVAGMPRDRLRASLEQLVDIVGEEST